MKLRLRRKPTPAPEPAPAPGLPPAALSGSAYNLVGALRDHSLRLLALPLADMGDEVKGVVRAEAIRTMIRLVKVMEAAEDSDLTDATEAGRG
jgi:hypothetical protein